MAEIPRNSLEGPLAPKIGLNENYNKSIPGEFKGDNPKKRNYANFIPLGAIALALLILPLTIQQLSQQQTTSQQASEPTPTLTVPSQTPTPTPTDNEVNATPSAVTD